MLCTHDGDPKRTTVCNVANASQPLQTAAPRVTYTPDVRYIKQSSAGWIIQSRRQFPHQHTSDKYRDKAY